jgi:uncharacterized protein (TIGR02996 family)
VTDEDALIAAIRANPADDLPRLVYADWLQERSHPGYQYVRVERQLAKYPADSVNVAPTLRKRLRQLRAALDPRWLARFEQPRVMRVNPTPYPALWTGTTLWTGTAEPAVRPANGTYERYALESLPPLQTDYPLVEWDWLTDPAQPRQAPEWTRRLVGTAENWLPRRAANLGFVLPDAFVALTKNGRALAQIRSCTGCYFDFPEDIAPCPREPGGWFIPFYRDSQDCVWWSLHVAAPSYHCVVSHPPFSSEGRRPGRPNANRTAFSAPSIHAFVYRWWIENEIYFRLIDRRYDFHDPRPMTPEMQAYLDHYRRPG